MRHLEIDLGSRKSQLCIRASNGDIVTETRVETRALRELLAAIPPCRVVMETCAESLTVANWARHAGHDARVVPATLAPSLGVGARGIKTDARDARALSEASCRMELRGVHLRSQTARERQILVGMRAGLIEARTLLINTVKGWMRTHVVHLDVPHTAENFPDKLAAAHPTMLTPCVQRQLDDIRALTEQIKAANAELAALAKNDPLCKSLTSVPGVGPITAVFFTAVLDTVTRFPNAKALTSYLGLTPGERSSSERVHRTGITKAGSTMMRMLLVQAAWTLWRTQPSSPIIQWTSSIAARRGRQIAVMALARKIAGILFALWRDQTTYDPSRATRTP